MSLIEMIGLAAILLIGWLLWRSRAGKAAADKRSGAGRRATNVEALDTVAGWPPEPTRVMTQHERRAHRLLRDALPECMILAQVPLARFLRVPTRHSYAEWMRRAGQLCADLVVCDEATQVIAVVDVRPTDAQASERHKKRHDRMDRVLRKAGVRVVTWYEQNLPSPEQVRELVLGSTNEQQHPIAPPMMSSVIPSAAEAAAAPGTQSARELVERLASESVPPERGDVDEPPPSTWFDDLDSSPMPLDEGRRR